MNSGMSFIEAMDAEIADLEHKLGAVRAARVAYLRAEADGAEVEAAPAPVPTAPAPAAPAPAPPIAVAAPSPKRAAKSVKSAKSPPPPQPMVKKSGSDRTAKAREARRSPQKAKLLAAARQYIVDMGHPISTVDMLEFLKAQRFHIGGARPRNNLASMFSSSDQFVANGRLGWTVKDAASA
jgi:hypothetical protein